MILKWYVISQGLWLFGGKGALCSRLPFIPTLLIFLGLSFFLATFWLYLAVTSLYSNSSSFLFLCVCVFVWARVSVCVWSVFFLYQLTILLHTVNSWCLGMVKASSLSLCMSSCLYLCNLTVLLHKTENCSYSGMAKA